MRKSICFAAVLSVMALVAFVVPTAAQGVLNYIEQGGAISHIGGELQVDSGGSIDVESGATLEIAGTAITSTAAELNALDLSAIGGQWKIKKLPITRVASTAVQDTGFDLPLTGFVLDVFVDVTTAEATGTTKTVDVGLLASETGGDEDGFLDGASVASIARVRGNAVATVGSNNTYLGAASTHTVGALLTGLLIAGEDTAAGGDGVLVIRPHSLNGTAKSVTYTLGSNNFAELVANIYVVYIELG